jgi:hypothetical protein
MLLTAKRLELLRELVPGVARVAVLVNRTNAANTETTLREVEAAARAMRLQLQIFNARTSREIDAAFAVFGRERPDAVFVGQDGFFNSRRLQLANMAARHAVPMASASRDIAEVGGLMSYGSNITDAFRQIGVYAGRILKGAKPADLPVVQSTKFELVINNPDRQDARAYRPGQTARCRRRGDRVECNLLHCECPLLALSGHSETICRLSAFGAKRTLAAASSRLFSPLLTQSGQRLRRNPAVQ